MLVAQEGVEPSMFTTWVLVFETNVFQPASPLCHFLISINIIAYFEKFVNLLVAATGFEPMIYCV